MAVTAVSPVAEGFASPAKSVKVFQSIDPSKPAAVLAWEELGFSVQLAHGRKQILSGVTGDLRPGELTCILGPSGSGKTSLLNILAGRVRKGGKSNAEIPGTVRVNGTAIEPSAYQQLFGYVMQDDALLGTMTPREVLKFAAALRLNGVADADKTNLIEDLLQSLGLKRCADTMVGNELIKGISGGERKRTAVGAELITNPEITFLDEPTSGLDTGAAYTVITVLQQLARLNRSVLCTIHQPSSEIFYLFDRAIFLVRGEVAYHGTTHGIRAHFESISFVCPQDYNPADYVMFLIQSDDEDVIKKVTGGWRASPAKRAPPDVREAKALPAIAPRKGFCYELRMLSVREIRNTWRDKATLGARYGSTIFLTLIYSLVFFQVADPDPKASLVDRPGYDVQSHMGCLTMLGISSMFGAAQPLLLTFTSERPVFMRESAANMYGVAPYFLSKSAVELPLVLLQNIVQFLIAYWMMGLQGNIILQILATTFISMAAASTGLLVACLVRDAKQAMEAAPGLFVPQILFAGFFIKMAMIPAWMRWLQYICSLKWGMNILFLVEFDGDVMGEKMLEQNDIKKSLIGLYFGILGAIFVGFRILAMFALARKAKAFYN